jgi:hypothetical protein
VSINRSRFRGDNQRPSPFQADFEIFVDYAKLKRRRALVVAPESAAVNAHLGFSRRIDSLVADMTRSIQRKKKSDLVH